MKRVWWIAVGAVGTSTACGREAPPAAPTSAAPAATVSVAPAPQPSASASPKRTSEEVPAIPPLSSACSFEAEGALRHALTLSFGGRAFAKAPRTVAHAALQLGEHGATAQVRTNEVDLAGEVTLGDIVLRPRKSALHEGWIRVHEIVPSKVVGTRVSATLALPVGVTAKNLGTFETSCEELTIADTPGSDEGDPVELKPGAKSALRATKDGAPIAELAVPLAKTATKPASSAKDQLRQMTNPAATDEIVMAIVLERAGARARVRILGEHTDVEAWADAAVLTTKKQTDLAVLAVLGAARPRPPVKTKQCRSDAPIHVIDAKGKPHRVGVLHPYHPVDVEENGAERWLASGPFVVDDPAALRAFLPAGSCE